MSAVINIGLFNSELDRLDAHMPVGSLLCALGPKTFSPTVDFFISIYIYFFIMNGLLFIAQAVCHGGSCSSGTW